MYDLLKILESRGKEPDQLEDADEAEEEENSQDDQVQDGDQHQQERSSSHLFYAFSIDF